MTEQPYSTASARLAATATLDRPTEEARYPVGGYSGVYFPDEEVTFQPTSDKPAPDVRPDQHRRRRSASTLLAVVMVIGAIGGFAGQGAIRAAISDLTSGGGYSVNTSGTSHSGDLRRLLPAAPAQARSCANLLPGHDEQLNAAQEATIGQRPDVRKPILKKLGYLRGAARCWVEPDGTLVAVDLLKFDTPDHAAAYHQTNMADPSQLGVTGGSLDGAGGVPGGMWFTGKADGFVPGYTLVSGFAQRGDIVMVVGYSQAGTAARMSIVELARQEYIRL